MLGLSTYLELSLFIDLIASACFTLIFLLIKIPHSEYSRNLNWSKSFISACFAACTVMFWYTLYHRNMEGFAQFATLMMLVTTAVSAATLSYSLISLLDDQFMSRDGFLLNAIFVAVLGIILARFCINGKVIATQVMTIVFIVLHVGQCIYHIIRFNKIFVKSRKQLEEYYDEEGFNRLRWIRFCYIIMMLTDMFILVYVLFYFIFGKDLIMVVYILFYALFMLYFTSNYISFLGSHKLLLDAFAHKTLDPGKKRTSRPKREKISKTPAVEEKSVEPQPESTEYNIENEFRDREFRRIAKALERWVSEKRYREYDKSRDEIAEELRTSKEMLQLYFAMRVGVDFRTWRTELRVEDAKKLLLEDKRASVNVVAEIAGFSDRSNFHRQFTKIVGCSPKEWRECDGQPDKLS